MKDWKYDHLIEQLHSTSYKKHENFIINSLFHDEKLEDFLPLTQYCVKINDNDEYKLLDLFYPQINLAIEINESHHESTEEEDKNRQVKVHKVLNCRFEVISIKKKNIPQQVQELKIIMLTLKDVAKKSGQWNEWKAPLSINKLKDEFENTLFVKIKSQKKIKNDKRSAEEISKEIINRQMGYWRIDEKKIVKINKVVVVCDLIILKVFTSIEWQKKEIEGKRKYGYKGEEILNCEFIGANVKGWTSQSTIAYSNDIK